MKIHIMESCRPTTSNNVPVTDETVQDTHVSVATLKALANWFVMGSRV